MVYSSVYPLHTENGRSCVCVLNCRNWTTLRSFKKVNLNSKQTKNYLFFRLLCVATLAHIPYTHPLSFVEILTINLRRMYGRSFDHKHKNQLTKPSDYFETLSFHIYFGQREAVVVVPMPSWLLTLTPRSSFLIKTCHDDSLKSSPVSHCATQQYAPRLTGQDSVSE